MSTMKEPVRLVSDPSCPQGERELLRHGADFEPPRDAEARVWLALVGAIGATAVGGSAQASPKTTTAAAKGKATGLAATKLVAGVVTLAVLVTLVALGSRLVLPAKSPRPPSSVAPAPVAQAAPTIAPAREPPAEDGSPWDRAPASRDTGRVRPAPGAHRAVRAQPRSGVAPDVAATAPSSATRLREETTLVKEARQALRGGDAARALRVLEECRRLFPAGVLEQERERLIIEALVKSGRGAEASTRAAEFLRKYPDSPHAAEIRGLGLGTPGGR